MFTSFAPGAGKSFVSVNIASCLANNEDKRAIWVDLDLRTLWTLLDAFFTFNYSRDDKEPITEALAVNNFEIVFEKMVDYLIGDNSKLADLRKQKDGKLIDHIYMDSSLIGSDSNIYYIGDSKYYKTDNEIEGVALYKQFTYARNAIQYNIDQYYLKNSKCRNPS